MTQPERMLQAYRQLCTAPEGEEPWPAVARSPADVEPFQRGWRRFEEEQKELARAAKRKGFASNEEPSLWLTSQVQHRMADIANDAGKWPAGMDEPWEDPGVCSVEEYCALETLRTAANFKGIARARTEKTRRQIDSDVAVAAEVMAREGGGDDGEPEPGFEAAAAVRTRAGLAVLGTNVVIEHHFEPDDLNQIMNFKTAERQEAFVKELLDSPLMKDGTLPQPDASVQQEQAGGTASPFSPFAPLLAFPMRTCHARACAAHM